VNKQLQMSHVPRWVRWGFFILWGLTGLVQAAQDTLPGGALLNQIEKQLPSLGNTLPQPEAPKSTPSVKEPNVAGVAVLVHGFRFEGVTKVSEQELQDALKPWLEKTVDLTELEKAADLVTKIYGDHGFLAQAFVPPQTIGQDGIVLIKVLEAKLGEVRVKSEEVARFSAQRAREYVLSTNVLGDDVNTRAVERAVYILNETPGLSVTTELIPGGNEGEVDLQLDLKNTPVFKGKVELANLGSRATGLLQKVATVTLDNPSYWGDQVLINGLDTEGSDYWRIDYSAPVGYSGLRANAYYSHLSYHNVGVFSYPDNPNAGHGVAETQGLGVSYPLLRSADTNANATLSYERRTYNNQMVSTDYYTSSYHINSYNFGLSGNHYDALWGGGVSTVALNVVSGRLGFTSDNPTTYGIYTPTQYIKTTISMSRNQQLFSEKYNLILSANGQLASVDLDPAEKFYLGGPYGVRAYPGSQGGGSQGGGVSVELQRQLPYQLQASLFADAGWIEQYKSDVAYKAMLGRTNAANAYALYGTGASLKYLDKSMVISSTVGVKMGRNPLWNSYGQAVNVDSLAPKAYLWVQAQYYF
jgi:hemolysin activation/secretion protein